MHQDLAFVAHLDDDLLFMNPDIASNVEAGGCVRLVYLTASDAGEGDGYMLGRERGVRAAIPTWRISPMRTETRPWPAGTTIARFTLKGNPRVQLWHMRLKDPAGGLGLQPDAAEPRRVRAGQTADTLGPHAEHSTRPIWSTRWPT